MKASLTSLMAAEALVGEGSIHLSAPALATTTIATIPKIPSLIHVSE
ncbi:MAG: hypothetical protein R3C56_36100 [Pirellulaceae bacterium]